jgi:hypothetical protein
VLFEALLLFGLMVQQVLMRVLRAAVVATLPDETLFCPRDGTPLRDAGGLRPGVVVRGKYRIVCELGRGGMGVVWRATPLAWNEDKALEALVNPGEQATKGFISEARVISGILPSSTSKTSTRPRRASSSW